MLYFKTCCRHTWYYLFRFKEVFFDKDYLAIAMEYASQGHLSSLVARQGKLPEADVRWYMFHNL